MRYKVACAILILFLISTVGVAIEDFTGVIRNLAPSAVYFLRDGNAVAAGMVVSEDGWILTCKHVVEGLEIKDVVIQLNDGNRYTATEIKMDAEFDLAVVKIYAGKLKPVVFGDSKKLQLGQWALTFGAPYGLTKSVSLGIITGLNRDFWIRDQHYTKMIQTDAAINPGNSGGMLFDVDGKVIGINAAGAFGAQGLGFSVPANQAKVVLERLISKPEAKKGE